MYARAASLVNSLSSLAHHFLPVSSKSYKLQPGGAGYELTYASTAVLPYLASLGGAPSGADISAQLDASFAAIAAHEQTLLAPLLGYLRSRRERGVRIVGAEREGLGRVPTVSFVVVGERAMRSRDLVAAFDKKGDVSAFPCFLEDGGC